MSFNFSRKDIQEMIATGICLIFLTIIVIGVACLYNIDNNETEKPVIINSYNTE